MISATTARDTDASLSSSAIDFTRPFIPREFCPFSYLPEATRLPPEIVLRQNQLHGLFALELIQLFEGAARQAMAPLARKFKGTEIGTLAQNFVIEEAEHSKGFAALNRAAAPELYSESDFFFVRMPSWAAAFTRVFFSSPTRFPFWPWLMLLQEEKALYLSRAYLREGGRLEPHFVAVQRKHAADEAHHVGWDERLIAALWPQTPAWWRRTNARLLAWLVKEFFHAPKRAGTRMLTQLAHEFPDHATRLQRLRPAVAALGENPGWQRATYSREMLPRTFKLIARWPELAVLERALPGCSIAHR